MERTFQMRVWALQRKLKAARKTPCNRNICLELNNTFIRMAQQVPFKMKIPPIEQDSSFKYMRSVFKHIQVACTTSIADTGAPVLLNEFGPAFYIVSSQA